MAAHKKTLIACAILALAVTRWTAVAVPQAAAAAAPRRIISLVPAVTEMLFAIGAGPQVVAVSSYDSFPPEVKALPKVGALIDPNVERILSLEPDLVIVYGSQTDLKQQLTRASIGMFDYRHGGLADVSQTIRSLGQDTGHEAEANALVTSIQRGMDDIRKRVQGRERPRTMLVFGRERLSLRGIYASGGVGFLSDMLAAAGGDNVFADVKQESVQASTEVVLTRKPDVILEIRSDSGALAPADQAAELAVWRAVPSVPAVRNGRVVFLSDDRIVVPGPRVVEGTRLLARALHPEAFR